MGDIKYRFKCGQKLTQKQIDEIENAKKLPVTFDEDSPEIDPVKTPELYAALMKAVGERNRRVTGKDKNLA